MGKQFNVRCDSDLQNKVEAAAVKLGWKPAELFREAMRQYLKGDETNQLLIDFEKRQAGSFKSLHRVLRQHRNELQIIMTVFELFIKTYFLHTPPVPTEARATAKTQAMERYENLIRSITEVMQAGGSLTSIAVAIDDVGIKE